ncbi:competence protein CoiA [Marinobacter sp. 1-4A]|uniref:competence protein CoiA n=1 Tax=Marinobacter sp. 1-4A TaxID=2582919 RepID=UPI001D11901D|nr:competence protein CoiA family protein [Marinobacter sp. 1-4A]
MALGEVSVRYAFVNGYRVEPKKGLNGTCPCCNSDVIAKCGNFKVHHWAHKTRETCDPWWENESEWHRTWKSYFPSENQERVFIDEKTGERHIADVYVDKNVVIEFQSYSISAEEMDARELFYQQMIWVVNGAKRDFDRIYFHQSVYGPHTDDTYLRKIRWVGRSKLLAKWEAATKHVYMDFGTDLVWHLIEYDPDTKKGLVKAYPKQKFVEFFGGTYS